MPPMERPDQPFTMPADLPPTSLRPSGISFDSRLPEDIDALRHSSNIVPVPAEDEADPYPYDVPDPGPAPPARDRAQEVLLSEVYVAMATLSPKQQAAVRAYFGLDTGEPATYYQVAQRLELSPGYAHKLVNGGIELLRAALETPPPEAAEAAAEPPPALNDLPEELSMEEPPAAAIPAPVVVAAEPLTPAAPAPVSGGYTYRRRHIPPPRSNGPTVHVAADVGDSKWTVDFDIERYEAALRAQGLTESQISDRVVLVFAGRTMANWLLAPGGAVGATVVHREGKRLNLLLPEKSGARWERHQLITVKAGPDADFHLAYHTLALAGKLPPAEESKLTMREAMKYAGAVVSSAGAILTAETVFLSVPELVEPLALSSLAGLGIMGVAALMPNGQQRAVDRWQKEFGPIITVRRRQPLTQRFPRLGRLSGIMKRDER